MTAMENDENSHRDETAVTLSTKKRPNLDFEEPSPKKSVTDTRLTEERHFYRMYERVLQYVRENHALDPDGKPWSDFDFYVHMAMEEVIKSFRWDRGHRFSDVDYGLFENVCAYVFRYGTHGAGLTRYRVLEAAHDCKELEMCLSRGQGPLRVVSLGGGPGNDALGFCSALMEMGFPERRGLDIVIVDPIPQWEVCVDVLKHLAKEGRFGDVSELFRRDNVRVNFLCAELPADGECHDAIRGADVILMSKLLSIVNWKEKGELIEYVHSTMKDGALLLIIDCPLPISTDHWKTFRHLYNPQEQPLPYKLLETHSRFCSSDDVTSTADISVLIKPRPSEERP